MTSIIIERLENKLDDGDRELCDSDITVAEIEQAIDQLKPDRNPGSDGLTANFYRVFKKCACTDFTTNICKSRT